MEIDLTHEEKKELRTMYAWYKSLTSKDKEEKNDVKQEYEEKFPHLKEKGISISDLDKLIFSQNQLNFIEDAQDTEFEIDYSYSGRGMFGDVCPAIRCDSHNDITTKAKTKIDSMGLGIVIYAEY